MHSCRRPVFSVCVLVYLCVHILMTFISNETKMLSLNVIHANMHVQPWNGIIMIIQLDGFLQQICQTFGKIADYSFFWNKEFHQTCRPLSSNHLYSTSWAPSADENVTTKCPGKVLQCLTLLKQHPNCYSIQLYIQVFKHSHDRRLYWKTYRWFCMIVTNLKIDCNFKNHFSVRNIITLTNNMK